MEGRAGAIVELCAPILSRYRSKYGIKAIVAIDCSGDSPGRSKGD
jgi:hypothetical protein